MASSATPESLKGYDHQFLDQPQDLICLICLSVARDSQQISCCGKTMCKACLEEHKRHFNKCPHCRKSIVSFRDRKSDQRIKSLKTRCDNTDNGCQWIGELRSLDKHMLSCDFALIECPNECKCDKETYEMLRKDIDKHVNKECPRRQYECPRCNETGEYQERTTTHLNTCPKVEVVCPNDGCGERLQRYKVALHREECLYELCPCKYIKLGCDEEARRKDLQDHEEDFQQHLELAMDTIVEQKAVIQQQKAEIIQQDDKFAQLLTQLPVTDMNSKFKVGGFDHLKKSENDFLSPGFYTSQGGYKMRIRVNVNGNGVGEGTHVSVFAYLMRGENDDHLPWPFTGTVTVELLNQLEDKNHHSEEVTFPQKHNVSQRVTDGEKAQAGWGCQRYIPHSSLGYDEENHCQYLKDDCLYFRVKVNAQSTPRPWLSSFV